MPFDPDLAERVRRTLALRADLTEKRMFGGVSFLLGGNVACCVIPAGLLIRHAPDHAPKLLERTGARPFEMGGKLQRGWLVVEAASVVDARNLKRWLEVGATYALSLRPK